MIWLISVKRRDLRRKYFKFKKLQNGIRAEFGEEDK